MQTAPGEVAPPFGGRGRAGVVRSPPVSDAEFAAARRWPQEDDQRLALACLQQVPGASPGRDGAGKVAELRPGGKMTSIGSASSRAARAGARAIAIRSTRIVCKRVRLAVNR